VVGQLPALDRALRPLADDLSWVLSYRLLHDRLTEGFEIACSQKFKEALQHRGFVQKKTIQGYELVGLVFKAQQPNRSRCRRERKSPYRRSSWGRAAPSFLSKTLNSQDGSALRGAVCISKGEIHVPWNDKSLRLRGLRDRLHLTGQRAPTFNQSVDITLEIIGLVKSRRNLSYVRRDIQKLRDRTPDMTLDQLSKVELLEQKLARKLEMADNRKQRSAGARAKKQTQESSKPVTPAPGIVDIWDL